jgi:trimeric autotransporter adhesin
MAAGLGFKTFTTGEVLTAGDVNGYLMQGINVFATTAARDAAITAPAEGQFAFTKDTNGLWYYDGAAWVASGATGDIEGVTAGVGISGGGTSGTVTVTNSMATAIDAKGDLVPGTGADTFARLAVGADGTVLMADSVEATGLKWAAPSPPSYAWTSYTPVIKGGATTVTKTIQYAKYAQIDKLVFVQVSVIVTSTGATNGAITVSLPSGLLPTTQNSRFTRGSFMLTDAGVGFYTGTAIIFQDVVYGMSSSAGDFMGANTPAMTLVNTDEISLQVVYEVA